MGTVAAKALELLTADIGVAETPPGSNRNKYGKYWGVDGQPYCAMGVSWAYKEAGGQLDISASGYWGYVPTGYNWATRHGQITTDPQPGDIVLFGAQDPSGDVGDHTGLFVRWVDRARGSFATVEANTSRENDTDGIYVAARTRDMGWVLGFWHPPQADLTVGGDFTNQSGPPAEEEEDMAKLYLSKAERPILVSGITYRDIGSRPWDDMLAGLLDMEAKGLIPKMPRDDKGNVAWSKLEHLSDSALALYGVTP